MLKWISAAIAGAALLAASAVAQAQTFTWTGPSGFNDATQTINPGVRANTLDINSTSGAGFVDKNLFGPTTFKIDLRLDGNWTNIYSQVVSNNFVFVNSLPVFTFLTSVVSGIRFTSAPDSFLGNYFLFDSFLGLPGSTTFTFSEAAVAVPGPLAGAGLPALFGIAGVAVWRRRRRVAAA